VNVAFVVRADENARYRSIVDRQQRTGSIYGSAFNGGSPVYRLELAKRLEPEIAAVGSSRVMSFRKEFFSRPFANLGGVVANLDEGKRFVDMLGTTRFPKVVLFGIDYWWMNQVATKLERGMDGNVLTFRKLTSPLLLLADGKMEPDLFRDVLLGRTRNNPKTILPTMGLFALKTMGGMRPDGSVHYGSQYFATPEEDPEPSDTWKAQQRDFRIRGGRPIDPRNIEMLKRLVAEMEGRGIHVVVFIPPVAPTIRDGIARDATADRFVESFRETVKAALGPRVLDFHAAVPDGDDDCEFIDGYHGGEITYVRILKAMAEADPVLAPMIDAAAIDAAIAGFKGHALALLDRKAYRGAETDFLGIGCRK
jgi:hypothetical protein